MWNCTEQVMMANERGDEYIEVCGEVEFNNWE